MIFRQILPIFDWKKSPSADLVLPPGMITMKVDIRDSLGSSTGWMPLTKTLTVQSQDEVSSSATRRRLLSSSADRWPDAKKKMQESIALADYALINQLASALSIELQERVEKGADVR